MDEQELCKKRLIDLSNQANMKGIVTFSSFLNLNELNIYHNCRNAFYTKAEASGGYENAERQMIAFIPDALCYEWEYPIRCICAEPRYPKFAETLTHRDILGALMSLGIERKKLGDIICRDQKFYILSDDAISGFLTTELQQVKHTVMKCSQIQDLSQLSTCIRFDEQYEIIASNRIDCIIAKAYHFSRSQAAEQLIGENVFVNGKCITNCNQSCDSGCIISVRGHGRFRFETSNERNKKGKLRVKLMFYQ